MDNIIYKRLFDVLVLHEYYLTNGDGTSLFDSNLNKADFLMQRFAKGAPSIADSLLYKLPLAIQKICTNYHLHLVVNYSGFSILQKVVDETLPDGTIVYKPLVKLPDDVNIMVQLSVKNNLLAAVTNTRIDSAIPAIYYFTNEDIITSKKMPSLSTGIPLFDTTYLYEQGELYADALNKVFQFDTTSPIPVNGTAYANTRDQLIVPLQFTYKFGKQDVVTNALFELMDSSGKTVRSYQFASDVALQKLTINFTNNQSLNIAPLVDDIILLNSDTVIANAVYLLQVTVNNIKILLHKLMFFEAADLPGACWAVINIKPVINDINFCLYNADGTIKYSKKPDGTTVGIPLFEIRLKSRLVYWRYSNDRSAKLKADGSNVFLNKEGNSLVSKKPRAASFMPTLFKAADNSFHYLPNPLQDENIKVEGRKIYTDILVPESKLFPIDTS